MIASRVIPLLQASGSSFNVRVAVRQVWISGRFGILVRSGLPSTDGALRVTYGVAQRIPLPCLALVLCSPSRLRLGLEFGKPDLPDGLQLRLLEHDTHARIARHVRRSRLERFRAGQRQRRAKFLLREAQRDLDRFALAIPQP
jgi:hypothetical protein